MSNFEWQTEEEARWQDLPARREEPKRNGRSGLFWVIVAVTLAIAGWVVYRQVDQRVAEATAHVEADVLSAHNVVWQAAQQQDVELLETVLSGRDRRWTETQKSLVEKDLLFDPSAFGFLPQLAAANLSVTYSEEVTTTLSSDLTSAEVTWLEPFVIDVDRWVTETVALRQTAVYRQGARSWLLSPPEREFWGEWQRAPGAYITLVYPERDELVARRLVHDLDAVIVRVCTRLDELVCPSALSLHLRLESDARSLLAVHDAETMLMSGRSLTLPTPTLVGRPVDEADYQVLRRGYGAHVAAALITELVGYRCCPHGHFHAALIDWQLSQLGLRPWPLAAAHYDALLDNPPGRRDGLIWNRALSHDISTSEKRQLYTLIEFLLAEAAPKATAATMQRRLNDAGTYWDWLKLYVAADYTPPKFERAWLQYIYGQTSSARTDLPVPSPEGTLWLVCTGHGNGVWLYGYDWHIGDWYEEFGREYERGDTAGYIYPLPGASSYVLQERYLAAGQSETRLSLWQDGHETAILEQTSGATSSTYFYFEGSDPLGRYLLLAAFGDSYRATGYRLLDLAQCSNGQCQTWSLAGRPLWSPDGAQTLLVGEPPVVETDAGSGRDPWQAPLYRGDAQGQPALAIGTGFWPFWLDNNTYGYLRRSSDVASKMVNEVELVTAIVGDDTPSVVLRTADLLPLVDWAIPPDAIVVNALLANPADPHQVLVLARAAGEGGSDLSTVFLLELAADFDAVVGITPVLPVNRGGWSHFSPDGRWLAVATANTNGRDSIFHLIDLERDERQTFSSSGYALVWSADGQWLAQVEEDYLLLRAPAHDYKQLILHDFSNCYSTHWVGGD